MIEQTVAILKPDAVVKVIVAQIKQRYLDIGLRIVRERTLRMTLSQAFDLYQEHMGKFFFEGLVLTMTSGSIVALLLEGEGAVDLVRKLNGATDPAKAEPGTIRHDFPSAGGPFNIVHGSDSSEAVAREIAIIFGDGS